MNGGLWHIAWTRSAERYFDRLDRKQKERVGHAVSSLTRNPVSGANVKRLRGELGGLFRYRIGGLRLIYQVLAGSRTIRLVTLDSRGDVY